MILTAVTATDLFGFLLPVPGDRWLPRWGQLELFDLDHIRVSLDADTSPSSFGLALAFLPTRGFGWTKNSQSLKNQINLLNAVLVVEDACRMHHRTKKNANLGYIIHTETSSRILLYETTSTVQ